MMKKSTYLSLSGIRKKAIWKKETGKVPSSRIWKNKMPSDMVSLDYEYLGGL